MSVFAKRIGKFLNIILKGKPKTVKPESQEEMDELINLVKKGSTGDKQSLEQLQDKVFQEDAKSVKEIEDKIATSEATLQELVQRKQALEDYEKDREFVLKNDPIFHVDKDKIYLKPFLNAEMPPVLADEFIKKKIQGESTVALENFWKLTLLNENKDARRGLYNFISKQNLYVTEQGYFVALRRLVSIENHKSFEAESLVSLEQLEFLRAKTRRRKKGLDSVKVIKKEDGSFDIASIKTKNPKGEVIGTLRKVVDSYKASSADLDIKQTFTDNHTRSMVIHLEKPVKISRSNCDSNPNKECSYGLHVGTEDYVRANSFAGDVIVMVLVNPQHVVAVPYRDAHKMRVCEYLPFSIITGDQLDNFSEDMIEGNAIKYRRIEKKNIEKALKTLDELTEEERLKFSSIEKDSQNKKEIEEKSAHLKNMNEKYKKARRDLDLLLEDDVSKILDFDEIKEILKSRIE